MSIRVALHMDYLSGQRGEHADKHCDSPKQLWAPAAEMICPCVRGPVRGWSTTVFRGIGRFRGNGSLYELPYVNTRIQPTCYLRMLDGC